MSLLLRLSLLWVMAASGERASASGGPGREEKPALTLSLASFTLSQTARLAYIPIERHRKSRAHPPATHRPRSTAILLREPNPAEKPIPHSERERERGARAPLDGVLPPPLGRAEIVGGDLGPSSASLCRWLCDIIIISGSGGRR